MSWPLTLLAAPLVAQAYVVGAAGGPGTNFTSIVAAVAAVPDGATLLVRAGSYSAFVIDAKSLTVLCDPGVVAIPTAPGVGVTIRNLTPSQQVTLRGIDLFIFGTNPALTVQSCSGTVLIESCSATAGGLTSGGMRVANCADVRVLACTFEQWTPWPPALSCQNGRVTAARSLFLGHGSAPGIDFLSGDIELTDCAVAGSGGNGWPPFAAVYMSGGGNLRVLGASVLTTTWSSTSTGGPVLAGNGTARIAPSVTLAPGNFPVSVLSGGAIIQPMPELAAATGPLGGSAGASLSAPAGGIGALFAGSPGLPLFSFPFVDPILLQPGTAIVMASGITGAPIVAAYAVPPLPQLLGTRVTWQGVTLAGSSSRMSNSVTYVHW